MESVTARKLAPVLRGRAVGVGVGTLIGAGWMAYGLSWFPNAVRILLGLMGLAAVTGLLISSRRLTISAGRLPSSASTPAGASRHARTFFWINFALEIVLLNVALAPLAPPALHIYWVPAISLVVGLHFLPMAIFLDVRSFWMCGAAMMATAAAVAMALRAGSAFPQLLAGGEALINAIILWATAAWGITEAAHLITRSTASPEVA